LSRQTTEQRILDALAQVLQASPPHVAGVNVVARRAGVDKVLIYRYFGGWDGLLEAFAQSPRARPAQTEPTDGPITNPQQKPVSTSKGPSVSQGSPTLSRAVADLLLLELRRLRDVPYERALALSGIVADPPVPERLAAKRAERLREALDDLRGKHRIPPFIDFDAVVMLLIAGLTHLALAAVQGSESAGVSLATDSDWRRIERSVETLVRTAFGRVDE
jgi:AcrR family transcriptional regulator